MKDLRLYWIRCWWRVIQSSYDHFHLQHWRVKVDCYVDFWIINDPRHDNYRKTKYFNRKLDVGENWMHSFWEYCRQCRLLQCRSDSCMSLPYLTVESLTVLQDNLVWVDSPSPIHRSVEIGLGPY